MAISTTHVHVSEPFERRSHGKRIISVRIDTQLVYVVPSPS